MTAASLSSVAAVIVHYKTPRETVLAARSVADTCSGCTIVVVDNDSKDRVGDLLGDEVPRARVVVASSNAGYGAGCNRGARETVAPYLLFLNSDARVAPGAVAALVRALEEDKGAAAAGPRLSYPDGRPQPSITRLPTPWRIFCESSGAAALARGRGFLRGHTRTREDHARFGSVEALMGAALLVRRSAFDQAGGFDEAFFLYAEETDLLARLRKNGWRILYEPAASVIHVGGASAGDPLFGLLHASLRRYVTKHHGPVLGGLAGLVLRAGAAARYFAALVTPGERGRRRRTRYRAALRTSAERSSTREEMRPPG
ncbi:MAG: glycosyltransferase family 2 protein [Thermoanaerobaculia bacterium]